MRGVIVYIYRLGIACFQTQLLHLVGSVVFICLHIVEGIAICSKFHGADVFETDMGKYFVGFHAFDAASYYFLVANIDREANFGVVAVHFQLVDHGHLHLPLMNEARFHQVILNIEDNLNIRVTWVRLHILIRYIT